MTIAGSKRLPLRVRKRLAPYQSAQREAWPIHFLYIQTLPDASLSFTGPTNLTNSVNTGLSGGLSFTGPVNLKNAIRKGINGGLSFTGAILRKINTGLVVASLGFTGAFTKQTRTNVTGGLSFTGAYTKTTNALKTAVLSFTGSSNQKTNKGLTAGLSFTGAITKVTSKGLTAVLSFTGSLSFGVRHVLSLIAGLGFTGSVAKKTNSNQSASLSFTGSNLRSTAKSISSGLSFTGNFAKQTGKNLVATLSFSGAMNRTINIGLNASLSFTVTIINSFISALYHFTGRPGGQFSSPLQFVPGFGLSGIKYSQSFNAVLAATAGIQSSHNSVFGYLSLITFRAVSRALKFLTQAQEET